MKYSNPTVLSVDKVEIGKSYLLAELPAGILFRFGSGTFRTVLPPKYNIVARNCQGAPAEVWNENRKEGHRVAYKKKVKVIGLV
jgi:hypothetical protein